MQRIAKYIFIVLLVALGNLSVSAQKTHYQTKLLQQMSARIGSINATYANGYQEVGLYRGRSIVAACDPAGMITHLGLRLFSLQMNSEDLPAIQHAIMDFMERYSLELLTQSDMTLNDKLRFDKVLFRYGSPDDMLRISDTMAFSVNTKEKYYEVTWSQNEKPFVTIAFPAQFELILGMPAAEIQHYLKGFIRNARPRDKSVLTPSKIEKTADDVFISKSDTLYLGSVSDATYY